MLKKKLKDISIILAGTILFLFFISGCSLFEAVTSKTVNPQTEITEKQGETNSESPSENIQETAGPKSVNAGETPEANTDSDVTATEIPTPETHTITLWLPPQFDPEQNTNGGSAVAEAIQNYISAHPNVNISVRIKAASGDSSTLNTLTAANHIAPDILPSLALISRGDMETAVQRGLLQPITTSVFSDSSSWYGYARQSAVIDNTVYGLPILGDGLVLAYRNSKTGTDLTDWQDILTRGLPIGFAPSSSTSLFGTFMYLSQGGMLTNDQGLSYLDQQKLTDTLNFFLTGGQNGAFPPSIAQLIDDSQVWQRFNDGTMNIIISRFSSFRHYQDQNISVLAIPTSEDAPEYPLVNTWNLVMLEDNPVLQKEAVAFAEYLCDILVNDSFSQTAGYLPVRVSDHEAWKDDPQLSVISTISANAVLIPGNQVINKIAPLINNAVSQVIKNQQTPEIAAQEAIAALN